MKNLTKIWAYYVYHVPFIHQSSYPVKDRNQFVLVQFVPNEAIFNTASDLPSSSRYLQSDGVMICTSNFADIQQGAGCVSGG